MKISNVKSYLEANYLDFIRTQRGEPYFRAFTEIAKDLLQIDKSLENVPFGSLRKNVSLVHQSILVVSALTSQKQQNNIPLLHNTTNRLTDYITQLNLPKENLAQAKFVNHNGQEKFNITYDFNAQGAHTIALDKIDEVITKMVNGTTQIKRKNPADTKSITDRVRFVLTDIHIGMDPSEDGKSLYGGVWNKQELFSRLQIVVDDMLDHSKKFVHLDFLDLGDYLDGWNNSTTRGGHKLKQNMTNEEMFEVGVEAKIFVLDAISKHYKSITMYNVCNDNHCYSGDTQVLTDRGWLYYSQLEETDKVATKNLGSGYIEFQKPVDYIFTPAYNRPMHHYTSKTVDLLVTDKHRILYQRPTYKKENLKYNYEYSSDVDKIGTSKMTVSGNNSNSEYAIDDDFIRLCAWICTDGTITKNNNAYIIYQSKEEGIKEIERILNNLSIIYNKNIKKSSTENIVIKGVQVRNTPKVMYEFIINKTISGNDIINKLREYIPTKQIPDYLYLVSNRQFNVYLQSFIDGDGSRRGNTSASIYGKESVLSDLQSLCVINGHRAVLRKDNRGDYSLSVVFNRDFSSVNLSLTTTDTTYTGYTWCVTVPNSNLIVRRNGKVVIQGNSGSFGYVVNHAVAEVAKIKYSNVTVYNKKKFINHYATDTHAWVYMHGKDEEIMKYGFPLIKDQKASEKIDDYLKAHNLFGRGLDITIEKGDLHQTLLDWSSEDYDYNTYPAFCPSSNYLQTNYRKGKSGYVRQTIQNGQKDTVIRWFKWNSNDSE